MKFFQFQASKLMFVARKGSALQLHRPSPTPVSPSVARHLALRLSSPMKKLARSRKILKKLVQKRMK